MFKIISVPFKTEAPKKQRWRVCSEEIGRQSSSAFWKTSEEEEEENIKNPREREVCFLLNFIIANISTRLISHVHLEDTQREIS